QSEHNMTINGDVNGALWNALQRAASLGQNNVNSYTYAVTSKSHAGDADVTIPAVTFVTSVSQSLQACAAIGITCYTSGQVAASPQGYRAAKAWGSRFVRIRSTPGADRGPCGGDSHDPGQRALVRPDQGVSAAEDRRGPRGRPRRAEPGGPPRRPGVVRVREGA